MGPEDLRRVLGALPSVPRSRRLLVSPESWDDAGVYRVGPKLAVAQTVDFITPVVDDPADYGAIAASNALSDIYAMGGKPTLALSIVCFPSETGDLEILRRIVRGGAAKLKEAGVTLLGGHSVRDPEIKFGYAVTGEIDPKKIVTNAGAKKGDLLVLTKPLGTGILATALKRGLLPDAPLRAMTAQMKALNRAAAAAMKASSAHAATDVTGFGLLGHALNIARASRAALRFFSAAVPLLPQTIELVGRGVASAGLQANAAAVEPHVAWGEGVAEPTRQALVDPQTSGGLLIALPASRVNGLLGRLRRAGVRGAVVGEVTAKKKQYLEVVA
ncbi:MAG: selenide, water dikinase SelD [Candidatus Latescibacteria bacterium]|nr:selenide, water dikinase SelD [Candidatus Latescibacterota bacterium]